jgi:hypothetical protein
MPSKNNRLERLQQALVFAERQHAEAFEREGQAQNPTDWIRRLTLDEENNQPPESDQDDFTWSAKQKAAHYTREKMREQHEAVRSSPAVQQARRRLDEAWAEVRTERARIGRRSALKRAKEEQLKKLAAEEAQKKAERDAALLHEEKERRAKAAKQQQGRRRGRKPPYDWPAMKDYALELLQERGDPEEEHQAEGWRSQTDMGKAIRARMKEPKPDLSTVIKYAVRWLAEWRENCAQTSNNSAKKAP